MNLQTFLWEESDYQEDHEENTKEFTLEDNFQGEWFQEEK